ncbi:MAG: hypothetical protein NZ872_01485 [Archaeoglobaceae archaeon]|nr:hypothetical protein [Archaeoglobaceae archaeon]MDW8127871.1 HVO_0476 family zinc finger protein [Archaeoglobaceae archaeon]
MKAELYCDNCKDFTEHVNIKDRVFRCSLCGTHVHLMPRKELKIRAIFSEEDRTRIGSIKVFEDEELFKGNELVVDFENESRVGRITAIQLRDGRIVEFARAKDSVAVWLKEVGEVYVKFSLHKKAVTSSYKILFDGETEFKINEEIEIEGKRYVIKRIKLIDGRLLKKEGEKAIAKDIKRIYATYSP